MRKKHGALLKQAYEASKQGNFSAEDMRTLVIELACSPLQKRVLETLLYDKSKSLTTNELAVLLKTNVAYVSDLAKELAELGLIERKECRTKQGLHYELKAL